MIYMRKGLFASDTPLKLASWNVNGLRAIFGKNLVAYLEEFGPDILALQEIKVQEDQLPPEFHENPVLKGYHKYYFPAEKKGYSGTAFFTRKEPLAVHKGMGNPEFDREGRVLTLEFADFYIASIYFPNSQHELLRLDYKLAFNEALLKYARKLDKAKPVILTGDFNVAHEEIDLKNPKENMMNPGFYIDERKWFSKLVHPDTGFCDIFREQHPGEADRYTWWSYRLRARERNIGWRIDYFVVSNRLKARLGEATLEDEVLGSDHCPIGLVLKD